MARNSDQTGMRDCMWDYVWLQVLMCSILDNAPHDCNGRILAHIVTLRTMAVSIRQLTLGCKCSLVVDTYWTMQGCTYSTHWLYFVLCLLWLQVLGQCMAVGTNSFPPSWTMYDCMYSMATFWTLCSCQYSGRASIWVQVFIGHNLHDATCKYIDSRLLNGAHTHT